jgi:hypothetical protein
MISLILAVIALVLAIIAVADLTARSDKLLAGAVICLALIPLLGWVGA